MEKVLSVFRNICLAATVLFLYCAFGFDVPFDAAWMLILLSLAVLGILVGLVFIIAHLTQKRQNHSRIDLPVAAFFRRVSFSGIISLLLCTMVHGRSINPATYTDKTPFLCFAAGSLIVFPLIFIISVIRLWTTVPEKGQEGLGKGALLGKMIGSDFTCINRGIALIKDGGHPFLYSLHAVFATAYLAFLIIGIIGLV